MVLRRSIGNTIFCSAMVVVAGLLYLYFDETIRLSIWYFVATIFCVVVLVFMNSIAVLQIKDDQIIFWYNWRRVVPFRMLPWHFDYDYLQDKKTRYPYHISFNWSKLPMRIGDIGAITTRSPFGNYGNMNLLSYYLFFQDKNNPHDVFAQDMFGIKDSDVKSFLLLLLKQNPDILIDEEVEKILQ